MYTIEEAVNQAYGWIKTTAVDLWYEATYFHFEGREQFNQPYPTYDEVCAGGSNWKRLPKEQSIFHDDGIGKQEEKYIHPDGREAVFNGDDHKPMTDPKYKATYNYVVPKNIPGDVDYLQNPSALYKAIGESGASYIGHFFKDMLPYFLLGNNRTKLPYRYKVVQ